MDLRRCRSGTDRKKRLEEGSGCRGVRKIQEKKHKTEGEPRLHGSVGKPEPSGMILPLPITALGSVP